MRNRTTMHWMLTAAIVAGFAVAAIGREQPTKPDRPIVGHFALDTAGVLALPNAAEGDGVRVKLEGKGRAIAARRGVALKFGELTGPTDRVSVEITFDNPLERTPGASFAGDGVAVVTVGQRTARFPVRVHGVIQRSSEHGAVMRGQWKAVEDLDGIALKGSFHGELVEATTDNEP